MYVFYSISPQSIIYRDLNFELSKISKQFYNRVKNYPRWILKFYKICAVETIFIIVKNGRHSRILVKYNLQTQTIDKKTFNYLHIPLSYWSTVKDRFSSQNGVGIFYGAQNN